ncbi:juvenile hormone esterase-like isoform X2 [Thrips palmi]|uniref:Carboxylic ester hydrolase n=1 Tax=Thrips palmi TaxID=161013 RepID=A0A6P8YBZ4_THRPL|nr:juvenile hormone esterase-like isoform X2 [Thrips palmi]
MTESVSVTATESGRSRGAPLLEAKHLWQVESKNGLLNGELVKGADSIEYYSFKGIPYAKAPLGELRFRNPQPAEPWHGSVRPALAEGSKCVQIAVPSMQPEGAEDCLFLNVYSRWLGPAKLPVMVYIHGGGFVYGSGTLAENGPEFLIYHDVVLVTLNYRLGAFGFLNLDNDDIPGNMGLKDQVLALKWVQENIAAFGGDPSKVTIFGNSAGAVSVHYHTLSRASQGLFRAAIMQSGNALANFGYQETHLDMAKRLSEQLGEKAAGSDKAKIAETLRRASSKEILNANLAMIQADPQLQLGLPAFCPSPERRAAGAQSKFLTRDPESLVRVPEVAAVPTIAGLSGNEGHFAFAFGGLAGKPEVVAALKQNPALLLPTNLTPFPDTVKVLGLNGKPALSAEQAARVGQDLKDEYKLDGDNAGFIQFYGDLFTAMPTHRLVNLSLAHHGPEAPLFLYHFLEDGDYNWGKVSFGVSSKEATHTDELGYLMRITSPATFPTQTLFDQNAASSRTLCSLTKLWTNFAKVSNPLLEGWEPADARAAALAAPYAKLSADTLGRLGEGLGGKAMALWDRVFALTRTNSN